MRMSGKRVTPKLFRCVVSCLLPLIATALCAAQTLPPAGNASRDINHAGQAAGGAAAASQSVAADKATDAGAIVANDWSGLFSKPTSPVSKAATAIADAVAALALHGGGSHRPSPDIGVRSDASSHAYFSQAPPASATLA